MNMDGKVFGRLTVIKRNGSGDNRSALFLCRCECGASKDVCGYQLRNGSVKSCGCLRKEGQTKNPYITHGRTRKGISSGAYSSWKSMKARCSHKNHPSFHRYGGRGIKICDRWRKFENFLADMGERPDGLELDRINNDGDYCQENCRWVSNKVQGRNRNNNLIIDIDGESHCLSVWAELSGTKRTTITARLRRGLSGREAVFGPRAKNV